MSSPDRHDRLLEAVRRLPRRDAPGELAGRVVAALHAGAREERVARGVASLERAPAPRSLEEDVARRIDPLRAPRVLERLVTERVAEPEATLVRAMLRRLPRLVAPAELAGRLAAARERAPARSRVLSAMGLTAALAALVLGLVVATGGSRGGPAERAPLELGFRFTGASDLSSAPLEPWQRAWAGAIVGELTEVGS